MKKLILVCSLMLVAIGCRTVIAQLPVSHSEIQPLTVTDRQSLLMDVAVTEVSPGTPTSRYRMRLAVPDSGKQYTIISVLPETGVDYLTPVIKPGEVLYQAADYFTQE